jgi:hypothetical protein
MTFREYYYQQHSEVTPGNFGINEDELRDLILRFMVTLADYLELPPEDPNA